MPLLSDVLCPVLNLAESQHVCVSVCACVCVCACACFRTDRTHRSLIQKALLLDIQLLVAYIHAGFVLSK